MKNLAGCTVLLVEDDDDSRFLLADGLARYGALIVEAGSGAEAVASLEITKPDILVSDLQLEGMHGNELVQLVRRHPGLEALPAIALTGSGGQGDRDSAFRAGFCKHLLKPTTMVDLVAAIVALRPTATAGEPVIRELLAQLNQTSPCRFTSIFRFIHDDMLSSVWTYDRENPANDPYPLGVPVQASYCVLVRAASQTIAIENAPMDPRTVGHQKRDEVATYIGVPLRGPDGAMFGTLCSYDAQPHTMDGSVRAALETAAREIETTLAWLLASKN
ncbi:MAG: response regulator [Myxococcota bacterium]|nr:response regulator [Deltaproteobacteria bacterium]MDQ3337810.1 response regulator [Myxococcota bacterium]